VATRPIKIAIIGDDSQLKRTLKQATSDLQGFGKRVARVGVMAGAPLESKLQRANSGFSWLR
jgi:hypothetical protein|tara:strand:+ start:251 stop:436 length:186 start_codon:yes stop_codon:yes gene_type:complete